MKDQTISEIKRLYLSEDKSFEEIASELSVSLEFVKSALKRVSKPKRSKMEVTLLVLLNEIFNGKKIIEQYPFKGMYVDFYIPSLRLAIEADGSQHFENNEFFFGKGARGRDNFENYIANDTKKTILLKKEFIYLIRVKYSDKIDSDNIRRLINEHTPGIMENLSAYSSSTGF